MERPHWWTWELLLLPHVEDRMDERGLSEVELRSILDRPMSLRHTTRSGRWIVAGRVGRRAWRVVVEPDSDEQVICVVTAYPQD